MTSAITSPAGLGMRAVYAPNLLGTWNSEPRPAQYGVALLWKGRTSPNGGNALPGLPEREPRGFAWVELEHDGKPFVAVSTHLGRHEVGRLWQVESLRDWVSKRRVPVILAGDFNMEPGSSGYKAMTERLNDLTRGANLLTSPSDKPSCQIDYVFCLPRCAILFRADRVCHGIRPPTGRSPNRLLSPSRSFALESRRSW